MRVLVTGGRGDLGRRLVERLEKAGHDVVVGTRRPRTEKEIRFDFGSEPEPDLTGIEVLVHLATDSFHPDEEVEGSSRLWEAARRAGVGHALYISIVGIDDHPFRYYRVKRRVEEALEESGLPYSILRTTQFHTFIPRLVDEIGGRTGIVPVPKGIPVQPIDADVVADRLAELVQAGPSGRVADMAGPEVLDLDDMVRCYLAARGLHRLRVRLPLRGEVIAAFRQGRHLGPDSAVGGPTYGDYLAGVVPRRPDPVANALRLISLALFATMVWMLVSPLGFHSRFAGFGDPNTHFIRDTATFVLPLAAALWLAASRPAWRVPVLGLALAQNCLHVFNHLLDVNRSVPGWHGPVNLAALVLLEVALWQILRHERRWSPRATRAA